VGGAWAHGDITDSRFGLNFNGGNDNGEFIGGGQAGFNYQVSNFVIGVEGDFDWAANNNNNVVVVVPGVGTLQASANDRWVTTVAARFGWAIDRWLVYGKAGGGWVGSDSFTITNVTTGASITGSNNTTNSGWLVGGGVEWAFAGNWSGKIEYDFLGLNSRTFTVPAGLILAGDTFSTGNRNVQMLKFGINYRFGWDGRVTARY
jgi:outer membrane immunogenic protein